MNILSNIYQDRTTGRPFTILDKTATFAIAYNEDANPLETINDNYYIICLRTQKIEVITNSYPASKMYLNEAQTTLDRLEEKEIVEELSTTVN